MAIKKLTKVELNTMGLLINRAVKNGQPIPCAYPIKSDVTITGIPQYIPTSKVDLTLDERGARYGDFTDHARLAQRLQDCMRNHTIENDHGETYQPWGNLTPVMKQALTVDADKTARIINGDPFYFDNWRDKQGYAKLVEDRLPKGE